MSDGTFYKRCGCRDPDTGIPLNNTCPRLRRPSGAWSGDHGHWTYQIELGRNADRRRMRLRRGGFATREQATADRDHARTLLDTVRHDDTLRVQVAQLLQAAARARQPFPDLDTVRRRVRGNLPPVGVPTLAEYLTRWLCELRVDANTIRGYESHVRVHLIPHLGDVLLDELRVRHIKTMFVAIEARNRQITQAATSDDPHTRAAVRGLRTTGPATCQRIRATLRKALNDAIAEELITTNPAAHVKTPTHRTRPIVWTPERVARWQATGQLPGPVMVWTDEQVITFLDHTATADPDLHPLYHLIAYRGLRRGEACGLLESEVRLPAHEITVVNQIAAHGHTPVQKPPKSHAGRRDIVLDDDTRAALAAYRRRRNTHRLAAGPGWPDTGLFFTRPDGQPWHPATISTRFARLTRQAGLPPIRLHDLRHSAATIHLAAGADIKVVQELLGHTTSTLTRDTYQSVLPELHRRAADAVAARLSRRRRRRHAA